MNNSKKNQDAHEKQSYRGSGWRPPNQCWSVHGWGTWTQNSQIDTSFNLLPTRGALFLLIVGGIVGGIIGMRGGGPLIPAPGPTQPIRPAANPPWDHSTAPEGPGPSATSDSQISVVCRVVVSCIGDSLVCFGVILSRYSCLCLCRVVLEVFLCSVGVFVKC